MKREATEERENHFWRFSFLRFIRDDEDFLFFVISKRKNWGHPSLSRHRSTHGSKEGLRDGVCVSRQIPRWSTRYPKIETRLPSRMENQTLDQGWNKENLSSWHQFEQVASEHLAINLVCVAVIEDKKRLWLSSSIWACFISSFSLKEHRTQGDIETWKKRKLSRLE